MEPPAYDMLAEYFADQGLELSEEDYGWLMNMDDPEEMYPDDQARLMAILNVGTMEEAQDFYIGLMEYMMEMYEDMPDMPDYQEIAEFFLTEWDILLSEEDFDYIMGVQEEPEDFSDE